jgi:hypothetical protein
MQRLGGNPDERSVRRIGASLAEPSRGSWLKMAQAVGRDVRTSVENLRQTRAESLPTTSATPTGCLRCAPDRRREMADCDRRRRQQGPTKGPDKCGCGGNGSAEGTPPASTDIDGLSRFYLCLFQSMAIEPEDGTTPVASRGLAAGRWLLGRATLRMVDRNCAGLCRFSTGTILRIAETRRLCVRKLTLLEGPLVAARLLSAKLLTAACRDLICRAVIQPDSAAYSWTACQQSLRRNDCIDAGPRIGSRGDPQIWRVARRSSYSA